ncbi:SGNH/GDSL hydrolase family protein [Geodermatophilus chilensis]|uniref:SGNH/GDSL hydrolase family protein n=1 Tax=Geodermatophilus chilensis TaxID=2035835 RepID=UPI000C25B291|nr:SGNH/GDSL hydrolase family protein [Geodermatophilus chilensis]
MRVRSLTTAVLTAAGCVVLAVPALAVTPQQAPPVATHQDSGAEPWVAAWTTAPQGVYPLGYPVGQPGPLGEVAPGTEVPLLEYAFPDEQAQDQTMRMVVHPGIGGDEWRVKLSNRFGTQPVTFGRATAALQQSGATVVPGTDHQLTFDGRSSVTLQPGEEVRSDPVRMELSDADAQRSNVAVSLHVRGASGPMTWHAASFTTSYVTDPGAGDHTGDVTDEAFPHSTTSWFFLTGLEVQREDAGTVVALGDSITDGFFSTINGNDRWPDVLQRRLLAEDDEEVVSVVNQGIAGNMVTRVGRLAGGCTPCDGPPAVDRLDEDVLSQPGLRAVVLLEGINDIGGGGATAAEVVAGMEEIADRVHDAGIPIIGATLTPSGGAEEGLANYGTAETDEQRRAVNDFIRTSGVFDAVVDFAAATEDPADPSRLLPIYDTNTSVGGPGDHLHPNRAGFLAMGSAFDLEELRQLVASAAPEVREAG